MGEFFGFGEDLEHVPCDVPWQVGFSVMRVASRSAYCHRETGFDFPSGAQEPLAGRIDEPETQPVLPMWTGQHPSHGNLAYFNLPIDRAILPNRLPLSVSDWVCFPNSVKLALATAETFRTYLLVNELDTSNTDSVARALLLTCRS